MLKHFKSFQDVLTAISAIKARLAHLEASVSTLHACAAANSVDVEKLRKTIVESNLQTTNNPVETVKIAASVTTPQTRKKAKARQKKAK